MPFTRTIDLFIDVARPGGQTCLLNGAQSSAVTEAPRWMQGDEFAIRLFFRDVSAGIYTASTAVTLDAGAEIVLAAKEDVDAEDLLFNATGFTAATDATLGAYYGATLSLNTTELQDALAAAADTLDALVDVEVQNADNTSRVTFRFAVKITQQVYANEADPTPGTPAYPAASTLMLKEPSGGNYRFKNGQFQIYNPTTAKFHALFPYGAEGAVAIAFGPGET